MFTLDPSDFVLLIDLALAIVFALYFSLGRPRTWYKDRLGWVIFGYAVAVILLLFLIAYAIVFGQRVDEVYRFIVALSLGAALVAKTISVNRERHAGRITGTRVSIHPERKDRMNNLKSVAKIWYAGQRVLRTMITTALTVLPIIPQVVLIVQGQWSAEWLVPIAAQAVAINAALTAFIALPAVNAWLVKIGLGSVPRKAVLDGGIAGVAIAPDPKATPNG